MTTGMHRAKEAFGPDDRALIEVAEEYYRRADAGSDDVPDLFTDDAQLYFPKFGIGRGKNAIVELGGGLAMRLSAVQHNMDEIDWIVSGNAVVVEGTTRGASADGRKWSGGETPGGRFCSVFEFEDGKISRMHVYLDPDYVGDDKDGFLWGMDRAW